MTSLDCFVDGAEDLTTIRLVSRDDLSRLVGARPAHVGYWIKKLGFEAKQGTRCPVPDATGALAEILVGIGDDGLRLGTLSELPAGLAGGIYTIERTDLENLDIALLGWALGAYSFDRYKDNDRADVRLIWPESADRRSVEIAAEGTYLVRDLINTPAEDMGPSELAAAARQVADEHGATFTEIVGTDLLEENFPAVHAVGRASDDPPRLIDILWGNPDAPKVTLVGKGVCFDTGGLDLKPASGMKLMKKDMGGAAHVLGLAKMLMMKGLDIRLRVLVPAVENSVAGNALRPLDVVATRKGLTVEIGNTDAEGRVILADALAEAAGEDPELLVDFATLTGAARVALGTELPALFTNDDDLAAALAAHGTDTEDAIWRMPLWPGYRKMVDGKVADLTNAPEGGFGGAITAALFLKEFAEPARRWAHYDVMAWNTSSRPGRPEGGEAMGIRALYAHIVSEFG